MHSPRRRSGSAPGAAARPPYRRLTPLLAALVAATSLVIASSASARPVTHSPRGKFLGVVARGHHQSASSLFGGGNLVNHGGVVMPHTDVYTIYWDPSGTAFSPAYKQLVDNYFQNVQADSGKTSNVFSVVNQYGSSYNVAFKGQLDDSNAYPSNPGGDCAAVTQCFSDAQLQAEVQRVIASPPAGTTLPKGDSTIYFVMTPKGVNSCFNDGSGSCSWNSYCAYHSSSGWNNSGGSPSDVLYANMPFANVSGCSVPSNPNGSDADPLINVLSHEHIEAITDPNGTAWWDSSGNEIGDKCGWTWSASLGNTTYGSYDQQIGTLGGAGTGKAFGTYQLQEEWSNQTSNCVARVAPADDPSTASFSARETSTRTISYTGSWSDSDGQPTSWAWKLGDNSTSSQQSPRHTYRRTGKYTVTLTVTFNDGTRASSTQVVTVR